MPLSTINPFHHACDLSELDYSQVQNGLIKCEVCPREWKLIPVYSGGAKWINSCEVRMPGAIQFDWLAGWTPLPKPTAEEVLANRAKRLDMLDQKARETATRLQDSQYFFDWLQKERGSGGKVDHEWYEMMLKRDKRQQRRVRLTIRFPTPAEALGFLRMMHRDA